MISEACWPQELINEIQRYQTNEKSEGNSLNKKKSEKKKPDN